ncbi:NAD-dependent epimerase/dehydratase family protein [Fodinicola feengrottensis]|uniref:NAD-dependent epimerase/dehydratase family protein n=1 Tax=Fodinicola feengrottensis TaxID=435914 RepID=UPI0013D25F8B|nr:NAD(P)-dependent oxidoreductase [Fodinicola feengrottensis]
MRVLVIGGCGTVGRMVLPILADRHRLIVLDLRAPAEPLPGVEYHVGDARDIELTKRLAAGADSVLYMAMGPVDGWDTPPTVRTHLEVAVSGVYLALRAAHEAGVRHAIYTSSMSVFRYLIPGTERAATRHEIGRFPDDDTPPDARDFYGLAKRLGEEVCRSAAVEWDLDVVCLRLSFPIPDHQWPPVDPLFHRLIATSGSDCAARTGGGAGVPRARFEAFAISGDVSGRTMSLAKTRQRLGWSPAHAAPGPKPAQP